MTLWQVELTSLPVYDLTTFSSDHPGGIEALENCAGTDGTEPYDYAGHSEANMAKLQQFRVGRLYRSLEQTHSIPHDPLPVARKRMRSATSRLMQLRFPHWAKLAVTISVTFLVAVLSYQRRDSFAAYIPPALNLSQLQFGPISDQNIGLAFWAGIAIASSISCVVFGYLYTLFLSTLDYQNEVFSLPPTIPRKTKRQERNTSFQSNKF